MATAQANGICLQIFERRAHAQINQETDFFCGPAVLQATLYKHNISVSQSALARTAKTNEYLGTSPENMARVLNHYGLIAKIQAIPTAGELRTALSTSETVIALVHSGGEAHWVIIDAVHGQSYKVMDPWTQYKTLRHVSEETLLEMWQTSFDKKFYRRLAIVVTL